MAYLKIYTNLKSENIPQDFFSKIIPVLSKCVKEPVDNCTVTVYSDCVSGENEPRVIATFEYIGDLGVEQNAVVIEDLTDFMSRELGVDMDRVFLTLCDLNLHQFTEFSSPKTNSSTISTKKEVE